MNYFFLIWVYRMLQTNSQIQQDGRMILSAIRRHWDSRQGTLYAFVSDFLTLCRILMDQPRFFVDSHRKFPAPDTHPFSLLNPQNLPFPSLIPENPKMNRLHWFHPYKHIGKNAIL